MAALLMIHRELRDQILMNSDCAIDLATAAVQVAERQMRFHVDIVDFQNVDEHLDRLVGLLVQQVIQTTEVLTRQPTPNALNP